jgi:hypothetical protein
MARIPEEFPEMGAVFEKPYTEFEFNGKIYKVGPTVGGHNGVGPHACQSHPPSYDPVRGRWVVHVDNNLIHIDYTHQQAPRETFGEDSPFTKLVIRNDPDPERPSGGMLISVTEDPDVAPEFPVDCEFSMHLRAELPDLPPLVTREPLRLRAEGLEQWPPPAGTVYANVNGAEFFLADAADEDEALARILPGDSTILTRIFTV